MWTTPTDLALLVIELIQSIKGKGKLGISSGKCEEMVCSQGNTEWSGLGLFLDHTAQEVEISSFRWGVGSQCMLVAYPYSGNGFVIMTNTDLGVHQMKGIIGEVYNALIF